MKLRPLLSILITVLLIGSLYYVFKPKTSTQSVSIEKPTRSIEPTKPQHVMTSNRKVFTLIVKGKKLVSGSERLTVTQGDDVTIQITSDEMEELHIHGYDESVDLQKDTQAVLSFVADKTGRFPFELELSKTDLGALEVQPK